MLMQPYDMHRISLRNNISTSSKVLLAQLITELCWFFLTGYLHSSFLVYHLPYENHHAHTKNNTDASHTIVIKKIT